MTGKEQRLDEIRRAEDAGLVAKSRELSESFLKDFPENYWVWMRLADNLTLLHLYADASLALDRAEACAQGKPGWLCHVCALRGHLRDACGDFPGAEEWYLKAHELVPGDATFLIFAGVIAFRRGDLERALGLLTSATACPEGEIDEAHFNRAGVLLSMRRYGEAAEAYRAALKIDPLDKNYRKRLEDVEALLG